jgi:hypothetical protein
VFSLLRKIPISVTRAALFDFTDLVHPEKVTGGVNVIKNTDNEYSG